jgi:hypothetical protein
LLTLLKSAGTSDWLMDFIVLFKECLCVLLSRVCVEKEVECGLKINKDYRFKRFVRAF